MNYYVMSLAVISLCVPQRGVRLRFSYALFAALMLLAVSGCATQRRIPATIVDGGVNISNIHQARCAVQRDGFIVLTPYEVDCHD